MKLIFYFLSSLLFSVSLKAQNLVDPYVFYPVELQLPSVNDLFDTPSYEVTRLWAPIPPPVPTDITVYNTGTNVYSFTSSSYDGEYMIVLSPEHNFWHDELKHFGISYKMEIVSFPFTPPTCWDEGGCSNEPLNPNPAPLNERKLTMPEVPYNSTSGSWGYLKNYKLDGIINPSPTNAYLNLSSGSQTGDHPERLASMFFNKYDANINYSGTNHLPHTIIKHTMFIHCGDVSTDIIDSISWVYDNTRGRMRNYPFKNDNSPATDGAWDVVFVPELIIKPNHPYYESSPSVVEQFYGDADNEYYIDGKTINYYDFRTSPSNCAGSDFFPSSSGASFFLYGNTPPYPTEHGRPPEFTLLSSFLRRPGGECMAGYDFSNSNPPQMSMHSTKVGLQHQYYIDKDFDSSNDGLIDLSFINSSERVIYNPSEVTVQPASGLSSINLIFPEYYTFKTVLGRYPSVQEVIDAEDDPQNGGSYYDPRTVPVPVNASDLMPIGGNPIDYPELSWDDPITTDANGFLKDERYGYYYIEDNATITVGMCVRIFDARFVVKEGGTLRFQDHSQILGYEDKNYTSSADVIGRYKIRGEGGAILRNYDNIQYVQNGNINQTTSLEYIATDRIIAGEDVDDDSDQPTGLYDVQTGADVTFKAGDFVHLTNGFQVTGGNFHAYIDPNMTVPAICTYDEFQSGGDERVAVGYNNKIGGTPVISVSPNPASDNIVISNIIGSENSMVAIEIFNAIGKEVFSTNTPVSRFKTEINVSSLVPGIYLLKMITGSGIQTAKFVKE